MEKYGFVYIWRDRKHKRYYVGCHWGREDDGYICSSNWMRDAYRRRPHDFKRRILKTNILTKKETFETEQYYFNMIKLEELRVRYYNLRINLQHWCLKNEEELNIVKEKISNSNKGITRSVEHKKAISRAHTGKILSEETKIKMIETRNKNMSEEQKYKNSQILINRNKNREWTIEERQKLIDSKLGKKLSNEHKAKISESGKGRVVSEETKEKLKKAHTGRKFSEEHKKKLSEKKKSWYSNKEKDKLYE
jgi:hypothetical protein